MYKKYIVSGLLFSVSCGSNQVAYKEQKRNPTVQTQQPQPSTNGDATKIEPAKDGQTNPDAGGEEEVIAPSEKGPETPPEDPPKNEFNFADPIKHKTDFLSTGCLTHTYAGFDSGKRKSCRDAMKSRGYTHMYVYIYNEKDYGGPSFNFYGNPEGYISILKELINDQITPVVWLFPDDAPNVHRQSVDTLKGYLSNAIPKIDKYVASYVLGLELDEYWGDDRVKPLGEHLNTLTQKKIAVHNVPGSLRFLENSWADYIIFQYGFGKSAGEISSMTQSFIAKANGKPLVAGEYNMIDSPESNGKRLGDAAKAAGAVGFGNGGTP